MYKIGLLQFAVAIIIIRLIAGTKVAAIAVLLFGIIMLIKRIKTK